MYPLVPVDQLEPDESNPRHTDPARLHLLSLSLSKLGFVMPVYANEDNLLLSGHQRLMVAKQLGLETVPVEYINLPEKDVKGINILFNRVTNDFGALDTGSGGLEKLNLNNIVALAEDLPDLLEEDWYVSDAELIDIRELGKAHSEEYDKKAIVAASTMLRKNIRIPAVVSDSGRIVNGVHRILCALEHGETEWPVVTIPEELAEFALHFLNYLSMDFSVNEEFADVLRYSAYRRPQNNRGSVPKAYRFWANGERTLADKDSYTRDYWVNFRDLHGNTVCDFGAGLCKVAPFLRGKGINCYDFEPYRINPDSESKKPDPNFSRQKAQEFLRSAADGVSFGSIFLASVLNSIPFPRDRMCVLAIVHALSNVRTVTYGTCRDVSDAHYEYGGIRQASYFMFDSEPNVRLGDSLHNPKIQKFHSQDELKGITKMFWKTTDCWPGGNVFYFRCKHPVRVNPKVLREALLFEFHDLPFSDGTTMSLGKEAIEAFNKRLGLEMDAPAL
jgi:hypothetical protein